MIRKYQVPWGVEKVVAMGAVYPAFSVRLDSIKNISRS